MLLSLFQATSGKNTYDEEMLSVSDIR